MEIIITKKRNNNSNWEHLALGRLEGWKQFREERNTKFVVRLHASHPQFKIKSMKILSVLKRKKVKQRKDSDFKNAPTRGGYTKEIYEVIRMKDNTIWNAIGVVFLDDRKIFVIWERNGLAYICHERFREFDLVLKPLI